MSVCFRTKGKLCTGVFFPPPNLSSLAAFTCLCFGGTASDSLCLVADTGPHHMSHTSRRCPSCTACSASRRRLAGFLQQQEWNYRNTNMAVKQLHSLNFSDRTNHCVFTVMQSALALPCLHRTCRVTFDKHDRSDLGTEMCDWPAASPDLNNVWTTDGT